MRRRPILAAATGLAGTAGCLETIGVRTRGVVVTKQIWGRVDPENSDVEGPVATWLLEDGELSADLPADDAPLPTELPVTIDDAALEYLEANHAPFEHAVNMCESPADPDGDCSGPTIALEKFNKLRLGERGTIYKL